MKCKVRRGRGILSLPHGEFNTVLSDSVIINFRNKYTYESFKQKQNHLLIKTSEGEVDIVFTGETPKLIFDHFEKDQLVLKINKEV